MRSCFLVALFTLLLFSVASAAIHREIQKNVDGTCKRDNKSYKIGQTWQPDGQCLKLSCSKEETTNDLLILGESCGVTSIATPPGCKVIYDVNEKYPKCCEPELVCNGQLNTK